MYVVHDDEGNILHSISGPDANYGDVLTVAGEKWIFLEGEFEFNPAGQFVDIESGKLAEKLVQPIAVDKHTIAAVSDTATISDIPSGSKVTIISDAGIEFEGLCEDGNIELTASDPTTYTVHISSSPRYLPTTVQVVAR